MALFTDDVSINSILGPGSFIKGDIKINGFTRIDGDLDGNLETTGNVIIGNNARIRGNITAKSITVIGGIIQGNINAPESVQLLSDSAVIGDIQTKRFKAEEDVFLLGHCIALSDETAFEEAQERWQDAKAIASKALMSGLSFKSGKNSSDKNDSLVEKDTESEEGSKKTRQLFGGSKGRKVSS